MKERRPVLVAAGGTGGHLFPAEALSNALIARGYDVELITDERATRYGGGFPARAVHQIQAATPSGGSPFAKAKAFFVLAAGTLTARRLIKELHPLALVGFGGYPTVPPVLAASWLHVPVILHEANAVAGRANRFLAKRVDAIAKGFDALGGLDQKLSAKTHLTGNPVRPSVLEAALIPFPEFQDGKLRLLVTGGSQGARIMSDVVPVAIGLLSSEARSRLILVQQARPEDVERVSGLYQGLGVQAEIKSFFADLPVRMAGAHLVIARAGASTVSELAVIGRPAILVPFPHAIDQDQAANAAQLAESGAVTVVPQTRFTPQWLAGALQEALNDFGDLFCRAELAKRFGIGDAAERLADLVQQFALDHNDFERKHSKS
jgi:UDP-N-acetylglucosamine--N-acetylmuramyl-(pentapeptide) pyrophosphoryl-undecaprenol N-acetylglucosamine transferase